MKLHDVVISHHVDGDRRHKPKMLSLYILNS